MARKDRWEIEMVKRRVQTRLECKQTGSEAWLGGSRCPLSDECPGLTQALDYVRPDDCLVVWKLDQLGHSLPHLLGIVTNLQTRGVAFRSLTEQMDTTAPHGEFLVGVFGALAQYEWALTTERVMAGLEAAKRRDKRGGRPSAISEETMDGIGETMKNGASKAAVCRTFGVKCSTLYDALARKARTV